MSEGLTPGLGYQGQLRYEPVRCADRVDQLRLGRFAERLVVDLPDRVVIRLGLGADPHAARSSAGSASSARNVADSSGWRFGPPWTISSSSKMSCACASRDFF